MLKRVAASKVLHLAELMESVAQFYRQERQHTNSRLESYFEGLADGMSRAARELHLLVEEETP